MHYGISVQMIQIMHDLAAHVTCGTCDCPVDAHELSIFLRLIRELLSKATHVFTV